MSKDNEKLFSWYNQDGKENDIIISSRIRLVRNLEDYLFPSLMSNTSCKELSDKILTALGQDVIFYKKEEIPYTLLVSLKEQCMIDDRYFYAIALDLSQGMLFIINQDEHLKIITFASGFSCQEIFSRTYDYENKLSKKLKFVSNEKFGFLTARLKNSGTGLKLSLRIFVPSICAAGKFAELASVIEKNNLCAIPCFKNKYEDYFSNFFFDIYNWNCQSTSEVELLAQIKTLGDYILKTERKICREFADNNPTRVLHIVKSTLAKLLNSLLLTYEEAINAIAILKWGLETGVLTGISHTELNSMIYKLNTIYLVVINENYTFSYDDDIKNEPALLIQRLRAVVFQDCIQNVRLI